MKKRYELPIMKKLDLKFDILELKKAYDEFVQNKAWDGLGSEYASLCENHTKLPKMFFKKEELEGVDCVCDLDWEQVSYRQLSLTDFDESFELKNSDESSVWSKRIALRKKEADERWFRKIKDDVPEYFRHVLETIGNTHRTRFASLSPHSSVRPHIDYDTTYGIRLHIAIKSNDQCINGGWSKVGDLHEEHIPADGSVWFVNPGVRHFAKNNGNNERVHLIISTDSQRLLDANLV